MLLAIDAGNTNVVFALVKDREIRARWRIATDPRRTADEYAVWLHQLLALEGYDSTDIADVIVAHVVPKPLHNLEVLASKRSEEHTSELQSLMRITYAVFCWKKKIT